MTATSPASPGRWSSRVAALVLLVFSIVYGIAGSRIEYAFSSDPLGPRVFPIILAILLALLAVIYLFVPGRSEPWPRGSLLARSILLPLLILIAALVFEPLGFAAAMFLLTGGVARIFGASVRASLISGVVQSGLWYLIFVYLLEVYLPHGDLLQLLSGK